MLIDTASLYFRAFHGLPDTLVAADGRPVNAVRGLLDFLARLIGDHGPTHLICCWDDDWRPQWRVDLLPSYKTHRVADDGGEDAPDAIAHQVGWIRQTLNALGLQIIGVPDHEADDVIGSLCATATMPVDVVTGDRDLFQLADDATRVIYVGRGISRADLVDEQWVQDRYGIPATQYAEFAALRGDPSDGIPGVAGIGEKTAASLLTTWGSLDAIRAAARKGALTPRQNTTLTASEGYLDVALDVVRVNRTLPVEVTDAALIPRSPVHHQDWEALVAELALGSSAERIVAAMAQAGTRQ